MADQSVFDRIVMNIIHMFLQIVLIPNGVFPVTPLPKSVLSF